MAGANIPVIVTVNDEQAVAKLKALAAQAGSASAAGGQLKGVLSGIGAGIGIAGVMSVTAGVSMLSNALQGAVADAMEDERSIRALSVSLRDNVEAWDGNTAAIEEAISARLRLGFEDTALRGSLQQFVARTHDITKALELQRIAMDLARFRNIDLAAATDLLGKAYDGNVGALRRAGIAVDAHATKEEALAAVMRATAGQAEAYAGTTLGKLEAAQIRMGESAEKLGSRVLPVLAESFDFLAGMVDLASYAVDGLTLPLQAAESASRRAAAGMDVASTSTAVYTDYVYALVAPAAAVAAKQTDIAVSSQAVAAAVGLAVQPTVAYSGALGRLWDTADGAWLALRRLHIEMGAGAVPVTVLANGMTAFGKTVNDVTAANNAAVLAQRDWLRSVTASTTSTGGASRAMKDYTEAVGRAFDALRTRVTRALDAIHAKNLQAIEDSRRLKNEALQGQIDTINAEVDAAQRQLDAQRDAQRQLELERAVANARDLAERADAQAALDDFLAQKRIDQQREEADAKIKLLEAEQEANDKLADDQKAAEEKRDKQARENLDKQLKKLEEDLDKKRVKWAEANDRILKLLKDSGLDYETVGKTLGTKYATGFTKGLNSALKSIATAVARMLGISVPTVTPAGGGTAATTPSATTAAAATAASGATITTPTPATGTDLTHPSSTGTPLAPSLTVNINAGVFTGKEEDARRFAQMTWTYYLEETKRRQLTWPSTAEYNRIVEAVL